VDRSQTTDPSGEVTTDGVESGSEAHTLIQGEQRRAVDELKRGATIGRYVVLGRLGEGGMGVVFSGYDPELDRKVAIKVLRPEDRIVSDGTIARTRFLREAQSMAKLSHGNVAAVYDVGTIDERVFIAMEFIDGVTLRQWLERETRKDDDVDWRRVVSIFTQAGRGLIAAHQAGIIHRDFKPENVMVDARGRPVVLDFGLARPTGDYNSKDSVPSLSGSNSGSFDSALTTTGAVMGTPNYMAPEQHRGAAVDERTDQFAFCVALYEALFGKRPFTGRSARELASNVCCGRVRKPPRSRVPARIERAVMRGLQTEPDNRHPTMDALLHELRRRRSKRSTFVVAGGLVLVAATMAGAVIVAQEPPPCAGAAAPMRAAWDDTRRDTVRDAFVPREKADGEATFGRVVAALDEWAESWTAERTEACEAARVRGEQSEDVLELRYACLDVQLHRFDAIIDVLADADDTVVFGAVNLAAELPSPSNCADIERLRRQVPPPPDATRRAEVETIRERLAQAVAWADAGDFKRAQPEIDLLHVRAGEVDYPPVLADVLAVKSRVLAFTGHPDQAAELTEQALRIGFATGDDEAVIEALLTQAHTDARFRDRFEEAHVALGRAAAVLEHLGEDRRLESQLHVVEARVLSSEERYEEALAKYQVVLEDLRELDQERMPWGIYARASYGMLLLEVDRTKEAKEVLEEALTLGREALGERHPELAAALIYRARAETQTGDHDAALASTREAREILAAAYGEQHANVVAALNSEGLVLDHMGRLDEALAAFERAEKAGRVVIDDTLSFAALLQNMGNTYTRVGQPQRAVDKLEGALAIKERVHGPEHEDIAYTSDLLGDAQLALGRADEAAAALERSRGILAKKYGDDSAKLGRPIVGLGEAALLRGDDETARKHFTRVLALIDAGDEEHRLARARASFGLAQVLARAGQHAQAMTLAREAEKALAEDKTDHAHHEAVTAWLRAQG
jgi:tetratricopeptide (TPR) repeat protein/predicted Ser/Thr protein kinase